MEEKKSSLKGVVISLIFASCLFLTAGLSYAEIISEALPKREGLKAGEIIFHSALKTSVQFDSNIYLSPNDAKDDIITIINPSFGFKIPLRENNFSLEYDAFINRFARFNENSHTDHRIQADAEINLTDYKISITDLYYRLTDRAGTEDVNRTKRQTNLFRSGISTERDQLRFDLSYSNILEQFLSNDIFFNDWTYKAKSSMTHLVDLESSYRFRPKTSFVWENAVGYVDYYKDNGLFPNSTYIESLAGIKGEWYSKLTTDVRAGVRFQEYESSSYINDENYCNLEARGSVDYTFTPDDTLNLRITKTTYPSTYQDMNYYSVNMLGLNYSHRFYKMLVSLFGAAQYNTYPKDSTEGGISAKRKDWLYSGGCSWRYDVRKWVSLEAKYEYSTRDSRFDTLDYRQHLTTLACTVGF
ncbi:MAG: outer membrane beta-barrel protein [Candidatus Omnitrophota bacterium]|jgi:hypothetical protein